MDSDRARGVLLGLACGDALGRPVEFQSASEISAEHGHLDEMIGHGTWNQPAGTITDDTEQALCIARSFVERQGFDPTDVAERFVAWYDTGPFDIGGMTRRSLSRLKRGDEWDEAGQHVWENSSEGRNAGNGSVMRCPPLAIPYATDWDRLIKMSRQSSQITHADPRCTYGCAVLNLTVSGLLEDADTPLQDALDYVGADAPDEFVTALQPLARVDSLHIPRTRRSQMFFVAWRLISDLLPPDRFLNGSLVIGTVTQTGQWERWSVLREFDRMRFHRHPGSTET